MGTNVGYLHDSDAGKHTILLQRLLLLSCSRFFPLHNVFVETDRRCSRKEKKEKKKITFTVFSEGRV